MEKERKIKTLSLVALIVAVLGLTVAFAALSQTLTINGSASVDAADWDVHIESMEDPQITGDAKELSKPVLDEKGLRVNNINVSLTKPGDSIYYIFNVVNAGTIDADLEDVSLNGIKSYNDDIKMIQNNCSDATDLNACKLSLAKKIFSSADWDGDGTTSDEDYLKTMENIGLGLYSTDAITSYGLNAGDTKEIGFTISFNEDSEEIPKGNININLNLEYIFEQK